MATTCTDPNAMNRSGSSQQQRVMNALLPRNAKVDERDYADLILFAKRYAAYLNYYNDTNTVDGNWQALMSMDISVTLAGIAKTDLPSYTDYLKIIYSNIQSAPDEAERKKHFKTIFDFIFSVAIELDTYYREIPDDFEFREYFSSTIQANLQEPLQRLISYYNDFISVPHSYIDNTATYIPDDAPLKITLSQHFSINQLSPIWIAAIPVQVIELSTPDPGNISNAIYHIITHNLFNAQQNIFFKTLSNLVAQSATFLDQTLTNFPKHTPHYALYLSFLHLFKNAQDQLNLFAEKHLDFYYKNILRLQVKEAVPDSVHLVIELQKAIEQHLLLQGTLFKGGKDIDGTEIFYAADEETVINKATVKSLQSVYVQPNSIAGKDFETLYSSNIANSEDGQGAKIISANNEWFPFGNPDKIKEASLGFLIASHYLYLKEATRTITIKFTFGQAFSLVNGDINTAFDIQLTGKKGWYNVPKYKAVADTTAITISFTLTLEGDAPPIVGYSEKIHAANYFTDLPLMRFILRNEKNTFNPYAALKGIQLNNIFIEVSVEGAKDLVVQNDEGALDPSKPFKPFGNQPKVGSSFIMGSKEIFQKNLTQLSLVIDWDEVPDSLSDQLDEALHEYERTLNYIDVKRKFHTVKTAVLSKGKWMELDKQKGMFIEDNLYNVIFNWTRPDYKYAGKLSSADIEHAEINITTSNIQPNAKSYDKNEAYSNTSVDGFLKLDLNFPDFGHSAYPAALRNAAQSVAVAVTGAGTANMTMSVSPTSAIPKEPYTPAIKSFAVNYTATTAINLQETDSILFNKRETNFYHLTPFGYTEISKSLQTNTSILPAYENEGELFIGLDNLLPSSTVKVLFQIADGTSNPLKEENEVDWYYLATNNWIKFEKVAVADATKNFTQSGIVTFILNEKINKGNHLFNSELSWIKAVVTNNSDAVCKLIAVQAQAVKATLQVDKTKGSWFKKILPANTISKMVIADAAIKKIAQPYESFEGRVPESSDQFYTRVSERLRHKKRAITAFDFERIVLEQFPSIYKAKCINHTGLIPGKVANTTKYSETIPGHVTIVTIPDLRHQAFKNPLKPYTSIGLLTNIKDYLSKITSPFVKLHVLNPKFEEVQFQFDVKITPPLDETFYVKQLSLDIERFLCPWAFESGRAIEFGGKISKSVILNFIEERYYVDYVLCFKMNHFIDRGTTNHKELYDVEEAITTTGISVLVSYYDEVNDIRHLINKGTPCVC
jgi:hypothetical protein